MQKPPLYQELSHSHAGVRAYAVSRKTANSVMMLRFQAAWYAVERFTPPLKYWYVNQRPATLSASPIPMLTPAVQCIKPNTTLRMNPLFQFGVPLLKISSSISANRGKAKINISRKSDPTYGIVVGAIIMFWPPAPVLESSSCHQPHPRMGTVFSLIAMNTTNACTTRFCTTICRRIRFTIARLLRRFPPTMPSFTVEYTTKAAIVYSSTCCNNLHHYLSMYLPELGMLNIFYHFFYIM